MNPGEIAQLLRSYPGFVPGVVMSLFVSLALGRRVGLLLGARPIHGFAVLIGVGIALSATVTPSDDALVHGALGSGTCDLTRFGLPSRNQLAWPREILLNILLLIPLGIAIGLCPRSRAKLVFVVFACALPVATEVIQLVAIPLGRECESGDVFDNLTGLTLGIVLATAARWISTRFHA